MSNSIDVPPSTSNLGKSLDLTKAAPLDISTMIQGGASASIELLAESLRFEFGPLLGASSGIPVITHKLAQLQARLIKRNVIGQQVWAKLPEEFAEPELASYAELVHLMPLIDVSNATVPVGRIVPFRMNTFTAEIRTRIYELSDGPITHGLLLRYVKGQGGSSIGGYIAQPFKLSPRLQELAKHVKWPTPETLVSSLPPMSFDELAEENIKFQIAWEQVQARKARQQAVA